MNRWLSVVVASVVVASAGATFVACNNPTCGPGTKQVQQKDGTLACEPADIVQGVPCDADGGATVVGGTCVSAIVCGQGTKLVGNKCVGSGGPAGCSTPASGTACVSGSLIDLVTGMPSTATVNVALYNPVTFLQGGQPIATVTTSGSYVFQDFMPPATKLIAIAVTDTNPSAPMITASGTGDQGIVAGSIYVVDAYVVPKSLTDGWKPTIDVDTTGAFMARFFKDAKPPVTRLTISETMPVAGVQLLKNGAVDATAKYFDTSLTTIGTGTSTGVIGTAIIPSPPEVAQGTFPTFSGMGPSSGPITWEQEPGGSAPPFLFIARFHPNM